MTYKVPVTGLYDILALGAQGGNGRDGPDGLGAQASGGLALTAGTTLSIAVSSIGGSSGNSGGAELEYYTRRLEQRQFAPRGQCGPAHRATIGALPPHPRSRDRR